MKFDRIFKIALAASVLSLVFDILLHDVFIASIESVVYYTLKFFIAFFMVSIVASLKPFKIRHLLILIAGVIYSIVINIYYGFSYVSANSSMLGWAFHAAFLITGIYVSMRLIK